MNENVTAINPEALGLSPSTTKLLRLGELARELAHTARTIDAEVESQVRAAETRVAKAHEDVQRAVDRAAAVDANTRALDAALAEKRAELERLSAELERVRAARIAEDGKLRVLREQIAALKRYVPEGVLEGA